MNTAHKLILVIVATVILAPLAIAQDKQAYGWKLMTEQERTEHRNTMRSFKTEKEREQYRKTHHKKMQERAKKRGVTLPDKPQPRGKGMMRGSGAGSGSGGGGGGGGRR